MDDRLEALARRVRRMEREVRWHRAAAATAVALAAMGGLASVQARSGAASSRPAADVRARRFTLVTAEGEPTAALEPGPSGGSRLTFSGPGGVTRIAVGVSADGSPSMTLNDASGAGRVVLEAAAAESQVSVLSAGRTAVRMSNDGVAPRLAVADALGRERVWLAVRLGSPVLQFLDARGSTQTGLTTFNDDTGVAVVSATDRSRPGLVLLGKDGKVVWSAP